jgi:hypothetical protein
VSADVRFGPDAAPDNDSGTRLGPTNITYDSSKYTEAGKLKVEGVADTLPEIEDPITVSVNDTTIATAAVDTADRNEEELVTLTALDRLRTVNRNTITQSFSDEQPRTILVAILRDGAKLPDDAYALELPEAPTGGGAGERFGVRFSPSFSNTPCSTALDRMVKLVGGYWYVDEANVVNYVSGGDAIDGATSVYDVSRIKDTSAGLELPPYRTVKVIGRGTAGGGDNTSHMVSAAPPEAIAYYDPGGGPEGRGAIETIATGGGGPPTEVPSAGLELPQDTVEENSLTTQSGVETYATELLKAYRERRRKGSLTLAGDPRLRPSDAATLPDDTDTHAALDGESYLVTSVKHSLSIREGFTTDVQVGGLI